MKVALAWIDLDDPTDRAVALGLAGGLRSLGHQIVIVGPRRRGAEPRREEVDGFVVRRVGEPAFAAWPFMADAAAAFELLRLHSREGFKLWHCHVFGRSHRALRWAANVGRWPMLASLHLILPDYLESAGGAGGLGALLGRAFYVTAASVASLEQARLLFPDISTRSSVVPNGIAFVESQPPGGGAVPEGPYVLCASRLAPYKGLDILLMAFAKLRDRRRDLRLVLCGRDQMQGGLERFAHALGLEGEVLFAGAVAPARLRRLLDGCLFFALPSRRENLPLALLEAMAAGKPVLASRVGGIGEVVTDKIDGLLVPPGDVEALANSMETLCSDAGLRERLGRGARERSRFYDWDRVSRICAELYEGR